MPKQGCPGWEYERHPLRTTVFPVRISALILGIYNSLHRAHDVCVDTRPIHKTLFTGLTPNGHPYYAGHYRGERDCLIDYEIEISDDPRVGALSKHVPHAMAKFCKVLVKRLDELRTIRDGAILQEPGLRMSVTVRFACLAFVGFLTIHPFANGNGHIARVLLWIILFHFGYAVPLWTIDPRPKFPDYDTMIAAYRRGNTDPLELFVISTIAIVYK
jgi:fido (protein-threonine AMPylation protein)